MEQFEVEVDDNVYVVKAMDEGKYGVYLGEILTGYVYLEISDIGVRWLSGEFYAEFVDAISLRIEEHLGII